MQSGVNLGHQIFPDSASLPTPEACRARDCLKLIQSDRVLSSNLGRAGLRKLKTGRRDGSERAEVLKADAEMTRGAAARKTRSFL